MKTPPCPPNLGRTALSPQSGDWGAIFRADAHAEIGATADEAASLPPNHRERKCSYLRSSTSIFGSGRVLGLLKDAPLDEIVKEFAAVEEALAQLGVRDERPFLMLSLLALSTSPRFKFTDKGMIDTETRRLLSPWDAG